MNGTYRCEDIPLDRHGTQNRAESEPHDPDNWSNVVVAVPGKVAAATVGTEGSHMDELLT